MLQIGKNGDGFVPLIMMTHIADEDAVLRSIREIDVFDIIVKPTLLIRIMDNE